MKQCIINFAKNSWYLIGQKRMLQSFIHYGYFGDWKLYRDERELGCAVHRVNPYAFKAYALKKAYEQGYEIVIWADCSIHLLKPYSQVLNYIIKHKYMLLKNGWTSGEWCADSALKPLGVTREESFTYPHIMACVMGFDFRYPVCVEFMKEYYARAADGITFPGAWKNDKQQVSKNPRVLGHRHDQTAASIIAWRLGMRDWGEYVLSYDPKDSMMFLNRGGR